MSAVQPARPEGRTRPDMVWIPGATFLMGSDHHYPEEVPAHPVTVGGFWIDRHTVTNAEFARFVRKTGHVTVAEQVPDPADYPGARPELLVPASTVFRSPGHPVDLRDPYQWWTYVPGADWRHPQGPGSSIGKKPDHPVVQVAWADVQAYAAWAGKELPTEAEWELAARGGLEGAEFAWGEELNPGGRWMANTWQGQFPIENLELDGYAGTAPVGRYPANGYGLHDMIGNVWEWTGDWYQAHGELAHACCTLTNPRGGAREHSVDPRDRAAIPRRVMKGGSHLCAPTTAGATAPPPAWSSRSTPAPPTSGSAASSAHRLRGRGDPAVGARREHDRDGSLAGGARTWRAAVRDRNAAETDGGHPGP